MLDGIFIGNELDVKVSVSDHIDYDNDVTIAKVVNGKQLYAMWFTSVTKDFASIHASGKGMKRDSDFLRVCFSHIFKTVGTKKLIATVRKSNAHVNRLLAYVGADLIFTVHSGDESLLTYEITPENCKFM